MGVGWFILIGIAVLGIPVLGIFSTLAIYGVGKYISNAKTAEARNTLGTISKDAVAVYEERKDERFGGICPSASTPVPAKMESVRGIKYQSLPYEWQQDSKHNAGFSYLKFSLNTPQYFQYNYEALAYEPTASAFVATAHGDLNGDGKVSTFEAHGEVRGNRLIVAPTFLETDPAE